MSSRAKGKQPRRHDGARWAASDGDSETSSYVYLFWIHFSLEMILHLSGRVAVKKKSYHMPPKFE